MSPALWLLQQNDHTNQGQPANIIKQIFKLANLKSRSKQQNSYRNSSQPVPIRNNVLKTFDIHKNLSGWPWHKTFHIERYFSHNLKIFLLHTWSNKTPWPTILINYSEQYYGHKIKVQGCLLKQELTIVYTDALKCSFQQVWVNISYLLSYII